MVTRDEICRRARLLENNVSNAMSIAIKAGMAERVDSLGMYNVTDKGEYFIRGLVTSISRIASESKSSRWERADRLFRKSTKFKETKP